MREPTPLVVRQDEPFNAETPLAGGSPFITPVDEFYVRSHFPVPEAGRELVVDGLVERPLILSVGEIERLPTKTVVTTMECAGNGRHYLDPPIPGVQWRLGAVGTASWTGAALVDVLELAGVLPTAVEVVFRGRDRGLPSRSTTACHYERSLQLDHPVVNRCLLAFAMNEQVLTPEHGAPLRLIVPGWYGMASVKWLDRIRATTEPFRGYYQTDDYVMRSGACESPCAEMAPRAILVSPSDGSELRVGEDAPVNGFAWSGTGSVTDVQVSVDDGGTWEDADLSAENTRHPVDSSWVRWSYRWSPERRGRHVLIARARDTVGNMQPLTQVWNEGGYGNNASIAVAVNVI